MILRGVLVTLIVIGLPIWFAAQISTDQAKKERER